MKRNQSRPPKDSSNSTMSRTGNRVSKKDQDSAAYRLSRVPQKFNSTRAVKAETSESYAVSFYSNSGEEPDLRSPQEKLEEVNSKLSGETKQEEEQLEENPEQKDGEKSGEGEDQEVKTKKQKQNTNQQNKTINKNDTPKKDKQKSTQSEEENHEDQGKEEEERLILLIQKKMLTGLIYGENSSETVNATTELGAYYNKTHHPDSALRHLNKAKQQANSVELEEEQQFALAVEYADASFNASSNSRQESNKNVISADRTLSPYGEYESENKELSYRRNLLLGRIKRHRNRNVDALPYYEKAAECFEEQNGSDKKEELGDFYVEVAQVAEKVEEIQRRKEEQESAIKALNEEEEEQETTQQKPLNIKPQHQQQKQKQTEQDDEQNRTDDKMDQNVSKITLGLDNMGAKDVQNTSEEEARNEPKVEEEEVKKNENEENEDKNDEKPKSVKYYQKAYDAYQDAGLNEKAESIKNKLPHEDDIQNEEEDANPENEFVTQEEDSPEK